MKFKAIASETDNMLDQLRDMCTNCMTKKMRRQRHEYREKFIEMKKSALEESRKIEKLLKNVNIFNYLSRLLFKFLIFRISISKTCWKKRSRGRYTALNLKLEVKKYRWSAINLMIKFDVLSRDEWQKSRLISILRTAVSKFKLYPFRN